MDGTVSFNILDYFLPVITVFASIGFGYFLSLRGQGQNPQIDAMAPSIFSIGCYKGYIAVIAIIVGVAITIQQRAISTQVMKQTDKVAAVENRLLLLDKSGLTTVIDDMARINDDFIHLSNKKAQLLRSNQDMEHRQSQVESNVQATKKQLDNIILSEADVTAYKNIDSQDWKQSVDELKQKIQDERTMSQEMKQSVDELKQKLQDERKMSQETKQSVDELKQKLQDERKMSQEWKQRVVDLIQKLQDESKMNTKHAEMIYAMEQKNQDMKQSVDELKLGQHDHKKMSQEWEKSVDDFKQKLKDESNIRSKLEDMAYAVDQKTRELDFSVAELKRRQRDDGYGNRDSSNYIFVVEICMLVISFLYTHQIRNELTQSIEHVRKRTDRLEFMMYQSQIANDKKDELSKPEYKLAFNFEWSVPSD